MTRLNKELDLRYFLLIVLFLAGVGIISCEDDQFGLGTGDPRETILGTWKVEDTADEMKSAMEVYWVEISRDFNDSARVVIYNFYNVSSEALAILSGNKLTLPSQQLEGGFGISGSGEIIGIRSNEIIWTYTVDDGSGVIENVSEIYTRINF